jgi:hypothetical protein
MSQGVSEQSKEDKASHNTTKQAWGKQEKAREKAKQR